MTLPAKVTLVEVGPRDGLQNEKNIISTTIKIDFINQLSQTGLPVIEATSFVSPKWVPQLADAADVLAGIHQANNVTYPVLVPNAMGYTHAKQAGATAIAVFTTASESFCQKNTNCSVADSLANVKAVIDAAKSDGVTYIRGYVSCVLGCPYEGEVAPEKTATVAKQLVDMGCHEISLGDTIGKGTPNNVTHLINVVSRVVAKNQLAVHFHDTYGQALANIYAALLAGITTIDAAVAGLGGCPYAKGASGNVATEDVLYMLDGLGIDTGVNLEKLVDAGRFITQVLQRQTNSKVSAALSY